MVFFKKKKEIICFLFLFVFSIILCWNFITGFARFDHFEMLNSGYIEYAKQRFFNDGRIFSGLYILLANLFNINIKFLYVVSTVLGLLIFSFTVFYFKSLVSTIKKNSSPIILLGLSCLTVFNFMCVDILTFIESPIIAISILLYIIAAKEFIIDSKNGKAILVLLLAVFCYQGTINVFLSVCLFLYLLNDKIELKSFIKKSLTCIIFVIIAVIVDYLCIMIYSKIMNFSTRADLTSSIILNNIYNVITNLKHVLIYSAFTLPKYFYLFELLIFAFIFFYISFRYKTNIFFKFLLISLCNILFCIPLIIIFSISDVYICGRLFWSIASTIGMSLILLYFHMLNHNVKYENALIIIISVICIIINYIGMHNSISNLKNGNLIDIAFCKEVETKINEYSLETDISTLIIHIDYTKNGFYKQYGNYKSYLMTLYPLDMLLNYYTDINLDIQYSLERKSEFNNDSYINFTAEGNSLFIDIEI